jgi:hypothetical protein
MFLGGAGFHYSNGRTRAPSWCKVMRSDMKVLLCIPVCTCQTWDSLVFSLVQHAICDHSTALFTHCSWTLVIIIWPIAVDIILNSVIIFGGFKVSHWGLWRLLVFWVTLQCSRAKVNRRFGGTYHLHFQGRKACCLACLIFDLDEGWDTFLWNVDWLSSNFAAIYPRRQVK